MNVTQNNVSNASTPGYAAQSTLFSAIPTDSIDGTGGGVRFTGVASSRNEFAEQNVQQQSTMLGNAQSITNVLSGLEPNFDVTGDSGINGALAQFSSSFSALSGDPNSESARQQVLVAAQNVASSFQSLATATNNASVGASRQISSTVSQINQLASNIQKINQQIQTSSTPDPNLDSTLHNDLESLSSLVNFSTSFSSDGTVNVLVDGQIPLVLGAKSFPLSTGLATPAQNAPYPQGTSPQIITAADGTDITVHVTSGQLGGLLQVRNTTLPGIVGDTNQMGSLNQLAQTFADRVNTILTAGQSSSGPPPVQGVPLFQYSGNAQTSIAQSLSITSITAGQIATINPAPPYSANGTAQTLANLNDSTNPLDQISGSSYTSFFASLTASFGQQLSDAKTQKDQQTQAVAQAQNLRSQDSGVSLDQEAVELTNFQKSYEATSKLISVLASLTETTINIIN